MEIRPFRADDAAALAELAVACARGESDFVLNPFWESEAELFAEFDRFGIDAEEHILVADSGDGEILGLVGFLRAGSAQAAGLCAPIVARGERSRGVGGELLRAAQRRAGELAIKLVTVGIGTRNRAGYSLLASQGFRPVRQHFLMRCDAAPALPEETRELELSHAKPDDARAILEVYATCGFEERSEDTMHAILSDGRHSHAVARHEGRVVAFAEIETHWPRRVWVAYVGVVPSDRDRGWGSAIVAWALDQQFSAGAEVGLLMLSPANRTALRAYEKVGFRRYRLIDVLEKHF